MARTLLHSAKSVFWISGVLNAVFVFSTYALVDLLVHPQWSRSLQYVHALICRFCAFGRCFLFF